MIDEYDRLQDKMCAILSTISDVPRKKCDELVTKMDNGLISSEQFERDMNMEFGSDSTEKIMRIMVIVNDTGGW